LHVEYEPPARFSRDERSVITRVEQTREGPGCLCFVEERRNPDRVHLCRGNFQSAWAAEGGYEPVAEVLFNELEIDGYFLEYDDARSGTFSPLRFVPKGKIVVLGLVSTKVGELESKDELKRRIDEATKYVPLEQLCLSPQCGFSSTVHGNEIAMESQRKKLQRVIDVAQEVWGDA
jgi:5-methyltetrahydropteroyltriglutamate--homocysteine methyltransferase